MGGFPFADVTGIMHAYNTTIGGTAAGAGNLISGNNSLGIRYAVNCLIQGNFIGTNKEGTKAVGNQVGIENDAATQSLADTIGGTATGRWQPHLGQLRRHLSCSVGPGSPVATNVVIQGNKIGTDVTGSGPLGNLRTGSC